MNKAFVREPDSTVDRCPRCGSVGQSVGPVVLERFLPAEARQHLAEIASFCPSPSCEVAYFDVFERFVRTDQLLQPAYPKDTDAPVCACFGLTRDEIEEDARAGEVTRVRALLEKAKSPQARCTELAANGRCCVPEIQRYYLRNR